MSIITTKAETVKKVATAQTPKENAKKTTSKNDVKKPILESSADKRIKNLNLFSIICRKYNFLKDKTDELNSYLVGRDGLKETVTIENNEGLTFQISNSVIISKIMELCQSELEELVNKTEKEVTEFKI